MARLDTTGIEKELLEFLDRKDLQIRANPLMETQLNNLSKFKNDVQLYNQHGGKSVNEMIVVEINKESYSILSHSAQDVCSKDFNAIQIDGKSYIQCNIPVLFMQLQ